MVFNNFVRGKLDKDLSGRFDLPIFNNGFPYIKNYICNYKGNLKYRTGFEYVGETKNNNPARLIQFRFNTDQSYLLEMTDKCIRFYSYDVNGKFGYVQDSNGKVIELANDIPYNVFKDIQKAQTSDVMYLTNKNIAPRKLIRTSATSFTIENAAFKGLDTGTLGNPSTVTYYQARLWLAGFAKKVTTVCASKTTDYEYFTIPTENIKNDDALKYEIADISDPILWMNGGKNNLVIGCKEGIVIMNGGTYGEAVTSTKVNADLANKEGASVAYPTEKDSQMIYVSADKTKCYAFNYDYVSESFVSSNMNLLAENLGKIEEFYYKRDKNNLVYARTDNGQLLALLYNKDENIIGWFPIETNGKVESMTTVIRPDGKDDLFICVLRDGNYYIEKLADEVDFTDYYSTDYLNDVNKENYNRLQLEELKNCIYLDNAVKYDELKNVRITLNGNEVVADAGVFNSNMVGNRIVYKTKTGKEYGTMEIKELISDVRVKVEILSDKVFPLSYDSWYVTFRSIGDLEDLEGVTQSVVADGGYIGEYTIKNGKIMLDRQYTSVIVGYPYKGFAKSFNLGFYDSGVNTQTLKKRINNFVIRFVDSAGFKVGTSVDNLQDIQSFNPQGFYDSTPLLMSGDEYIYGYNDNHDKEKYVYLVQDMPLPCNVTMVQYDISFEAMR